MAALLENDEDDFLVAVLGDEGKASKGSAAARGRSLERGCGDKRKRAEASDRGSDKKKRKKKAASDESDDASPPAPPPGSERKRLKAKDLALMAGWKKCNQCLKHKEHKCFNADQGRCRDCHNGKRSLGRFAETQHQTEKLEKLKEKNPKEHEAVVKAFMKAREKAQKSGSRVNFNIKAFRMSYRSSSGVRKEEQGEMMWEGEYYEFAKTAKAGFLSKPEMEENWKRFVDDPKVQKDDFGPRGYQRCWVKTRDLISKFDEAARDKELAQEERLNKRATPQQMKDKLKQVMGSTGMDEHDPMDFDELMEQVAGTMAASGSGSRAFEGDGVLGADVSDLIDQVHAKRRGTKRKKKESDSTSEDADTEEGSGDNADKEDPTPKKPKKEKEEEVEWFDEAKAHRAQRSYIRQVDLIFEGMVATETSMKEALAEFRSKPADAKAYEIEMQLVVRRLDWLSLVLHGTEERLEELKSKLKAEENSDKASQSGSRDGSSLARAGPCAGFEDLKVFTELKSFAVGFRSCESQDAVKEHLSTTLPLRKCFGVLSAACRTAVSELTAAKASAEAAEAAKKKKADAAAKSKAKAKAKQAATIPRGPSRGQSTPVILGMEPTAGREQHAVKSAEAVVADWGLNEPFIISGVAPDLGLGKPIEDALKNFMDVFNESSIKITDGRAQLPLAAEVDASLSFATTLLPANVRNEAILDIRKIDDASAVPALAKAIAPTTFAIAMGHISPAKFELTSLACLRVTVTGTRSIALVDTFALQQHLTAESKVPAPSELQQWANNAKPEDFQKFLDACPKGIFWATVGPKDVLFTPVGFLVFHAVLNASDVVGIRFPVIRRPELSKYKMFADAGTAAMKQAVEYLDKFSDEQVAARLQAKPGNEGGEQKEQMQPLQDREDRDDVVDGGEKSKPSACQDGEKEGKDPQVEAKDDVDDKAKDHADDAEDTNKPSESKDGKGGAEAKPGEEKAKGDAAAEPGESEKGKGDAAAKPSEDKAKDDAPAKPGESEEGKGDAAAKPGEDKAKDDAPAKPGESKEGKDNAAAKPVEESEGGGKREQEQLVQEGVQQGCVAAPAATTD